MILRFGGLTTRPGAVGFGGGVLVGEEVPDYGGFAGNDE